MVRTAKFIIQTVAACSISIQSANLLGQSALLGAKLPDTPASGLLRQTLARALGRSRLCFYCHPGPPRRLRSDVLRFFTLLVNCARKRFLTTFPIGFLGNSGKNRIMPGSL